MAPFGGDPTLCGEVSLPRLCRSSVNSTTAYIKCGGLGFLDIRAMNTALLGKWIHRFGEWRKYHNNKSLFQHKFKGGSQFWAGLSKIKSWYEFGRPIF